MAPVYEWYRQGLALLGSGDAHAAATVLERAVAEAPDKASIREGLARALFSSGRFNEALDQFRHLLEIDPVNDWAHFGVGLVLGKLGRLDEAIGHLKMALVMRPENEDYRDAVARYELRRRLRDRPA